MGYVAWILEASINDRSALDGVMHDLAGAAQAGEPGTSVYEWNLSADGSAIINYERFEDSAAALAHLAGFGPHAERFLAAVTPTRVVVFGTPSDAVKEALKGFGATFTTQIAGFHR